MKRFVFCFAFFLMMPGIVAAAEPKPPAPVIDPKARELAAELVKMVNVHEEMNAIFDKMAQNVYPLIQRDPKASRIAKKIVDDAMLEAKKVHIKEIDANTADIYAQNFTMDELKQIVAFYKTPAGQKVLKTMPGLVDKAMSANLEVIKTVMREAMGSVVATLKQKGIMIPKELSY